MTDSENLQLDNLLNRIFIKYGYDFRGYSRASISRRINDFISKECLTGIDKLIHNLDNDSNTFQNSVWS